MLPWLAVVKYIMLLLMTSRYHNLKLGEKSSYFNNLSCPFGRYRYMTPFPVAPTGDMFQRKIDKLFQGLSNVFGIADDILITGFDDIYRDHIVTLEKVLRICRQTSLKLNKDKCLFWCTSIPFFGEVILWSGVSSDPRKVQVLMTMPPPKCKKIAAVIPGYSQLPK